MEELQRGLWRWTGYHPEWKEDVGCLALATRDGLVLVDPLDPPAGFREPAHVLITVYWHARSTAALTGARVWAATGGAAAVARRARVTDRFRPGDRLPGGVEAHATARRSEVVFWLPEQRALVAGDVLLGSPLRLCPASWLRGRTRAELADSLRPLLELPVELVLVSHGEPVLENGREALARALAEAAHA